MGVEGGGKPGDGNGMNRGAEKEKSGSSQWLNLVPSGTSRWLLFICYVMFNSLQPHGHARLHCLPEFAQIHVHLVSNAI